MDLHLSTIYPVFIFSV